MSSDAKYTFDSNEAAHFGETKRVFCLSDIYNSVYKELLSRGMRFGYNAEQAEDIIQQMFLEFAEKKVSFENVNNIEAFVITCFKRKLIDYHRSVQKARECLIYLPKENTSSQQCILEDKEEMLLQALKLKNAYDQLPDRYKTVIFFKFAMGLSNEEIVAKTGLNMRTVYNNLCNAIKILRREVAR